MAVLGDPYESLLAEYTLATVNERAEWKVLSDTSLGPLERMTAYARWRAAADRIKALSILMRDTGGPVRSPEP